MKNCGIHREPIGDATTSETRQELNCGPRKVLQLLSSGELEGYYLGPQIRVTRESIRAYKKRNRYVDQPGRRGSFGQPRRLVRGGA